MPDFLDLFQAFLPTADPFLLGVLFTEWHSFLKAFAFFHSLLWVNSIDFCEHIGPRLHSFLSYFDEFWLLPLQQRPSLIHKLLTFVLLFTMAGLIFLLAFARMPEMI
jgi:hypothetical protein